MTQDELPIVYADKAGIVKCPYCNGFHQHGGRGNGIAFGPRQADCAAGKEYWVIPASDNKFYCGSIQYVGGRLMRCIGQCPRCNSIEKACQK